MIRVNTRDDVAADVFDVVLQAPVDDDMLDYVEPPLREEGVRAN